MSRRDETLPNIPNIPFSSASKKREEKKPAFFFHFFGKGSVGTQVGGRQLDTVISLLFELQFFPLNVLMIRVRSSTNVRGLREKNLRA